VVREHRILSRRKGDADVDAQGEGPRGDDVPRDRCQPSSGRAFVSSTVNEPGHRESGGVAPQNLEDSLQVPWDTIPRRIASQEPGREADEAEEQKTTDDLGPAGGRRQPGRHRLSRGHSRSRWMQCRPTSEVEGDDHHDGIHQDRRGRSVLDQEVGVGRRHDQGDDPPDAAAGEAKRLGNRGGGGSRHDRGTVRAGLKAAEGSGR